MRLEALSAEDVPGIEELFERYGRMDFADATLVTLGEELELDTILTLDRRGFGVFRLHGRRPFRILP